MWDWKRPAVALVMMIAGGMSIQTAQAQLFDMPGAAVDETTLGSVTGRADLNQLAQSQHVASVKDSSVNGNSETGAITIDGNAFQNLSGLAILNANSGNNVAINASMNVNIALTSSQ